MRKVLLIGSLLLTGISSYSQDNSKMFTADEFVWFGLDFSSMKCIGSEGFTDPDAIKNKYFESWNDLFVAEAEKYNLKETYQKETQINNFEVVERRNELPNADELVIEDSYEFEANQLETIISDYNMEAESDLGLVYIVEALNKTEGHAVVYTIFFDIPSKKIIWQERFEASAGGFGFRNYWARSFYEVMRDSEDVYKKALKNYEKSKK